jgi:predicted nucleic-acid-binding protein
MIGLDTNVLIRYFTRDDQIQSARATKIMEHGLSLDEPGFVSVVVMAEMAWVLKGTYAQTNEEIAQAIERMLQADTLVVQNEQQVFEATVALKSGRASFADALVGALGRWAGCVSTVTFDKRAARLKEFELV